MYIDLLKNLNHYSLTIIFYLKSFVEIKFKIFDLLLSLTNINHYCYWPYLPKVLVKPILNKFSIITIIL